MRECERGYFGNPNAISTPTCEYDKLSFDRTILTAEGCENRNRDRNINKHRKDSPKSYILETEFHGHVTTVTTANFRWNTL